MTRIELPWPCKELMKNAKTNRWSESRAVKQSRATAGWAAIEAGAKWLNVPKAELPMTMTFHAPDKRVRDLHNMVYAMRAAIDGLQDALGLNDSYFRITPVWGDVVKGGRVVVELNA